MPTSKLRLKSSPVADPISAETTAIEEKVGVSRQTNEPLAAVEDDLMSEEFTSEHERIARLAYSYWQERGCAEGSPEEDWFRAEQVLQLSKFARQVGSETSSQIEQTLSQSA
jgi:hypothetical protein